MENVYYGPSDTSTFSDQRLFDSDPSTASRGIAPVLSEARGDENEPQKFVVPERGSLADAINDCIQWLSLDGSGKSPPSLIYVEREVQELSRTTAPHGVTGAEVKRLFGSIHFLMQKRRRVYFATLGDGLQEMGQGQARTVADNFLKRIVREQKAHNLPQYWIAVWECSGGLHLHVVFLGNARIVESLRRSNFGPLLNVRWAYNPWGLPVYLSKERTSQAQHAFGEYIGGARKKGSHRLPGGGDRVRLSKKLRDASISTGYVEPWKISYARRQEGPRKPHRPYTLRAKRAPSRTPHQEVLFPEVAKPPVRLRDFGGGFITAAQAQEIEFRRKQRGLSQPRLAKQIGISQPHYANVIRRHDPMSGFVARRLREILLYDGTA